MRLAHIRRTGELDSPNGVTAAEIEADFGEARFQLILTADILDLNFCLLSTERQQIDLADRADRSEPAAQLYPLAETVYGYRDREAQRLFGTRAGSPFDATLNIGRDSNYDPPKQVVLALSGIRLE